MVPENFQKVKRRIVDVVSLGWERFSQLTRFVFITCPQHSLLLRSSLMHEHLALSRSKPIKPVPFVFSGQQSEPCSIALTPCPNQNLQQPMHMRSYMRIWSASNSARECNGSCACDTWEQLIVEFVALYLPYLHMLVPSEKSKDDSLFRRRRLGKMSSAELIHRGAAMSH